MYVVSAMPAPAKASPISAAAGSASTAHHDDTSPAATMTSRNTAE